MMVSLVNETNCHKNGLNANRINDGHYLDNITGIWLVMWMCFFEYFLLWIRGKTLPLPQENLTSLCHGIFNYLIKIWIRSTEYFAYVFLLENFSFFSALFTESWISFVGAIVFVDFCYYWFHRLSHEVMIFWAIHQVHHLSIDFTVSVGIRHSPIQSLFAWVFYLPLAIVGLPVSHLMAHLHLNYLYQTLLHTEAVDNLMWPLDWVFNTPSHHRLHHGIVKRAIDRNYGGILIVWDRLFGTFTPEGRRDDNIYGILCQPKESNILSHQVFYIRLGIEKAKNMSNRLDYFNTFWKGPSWQPGSSRLGRELDTIYDYNLNRRKNEAYSSARTDLYTFVHIVMLLFLLKGMAEFMDQNLTSFTVYSVFIISSLTNVGFIFEGKSIAIKIEAIRCFVGVGLLLLFPLDLGGIQIYTLLLYSISGMFWLILNLRNTLNKFNKTKIVKKD